MKYFISGSKTISTLAESTKDAIDIFISLEAEFLIGDCYDIDFAIQKYLESKGYSKVTIYCSGETPKYNFVSGAKIHPCANVEKDIQIINDCDAALIIWDGKSKETEKNIHRILELNKMHNIFINGSLLWV